MSPATRTSNTHRNIYLSRNMRLTIASMILLGSVLAMDSAKAQGAEIYHGADLALGQKMIAESKCVACHISKVGGDGSKIYKPAGRINNAGLLRGMVEMCNTTMNLGLFPEDVTAVAAVLNRDHYKFK
jgi:mono/diheme cytochrome c family protein